MEYVFGILGIVGLATGIWLAKLIWFRPFNIRHFFERAMLVFALGNPEILSSLRIFERFGIQGHNKKLGDESDHFRRRQLAKVEKNLALLRSYQRENLTANQQLSYDIMEWYLAGMVEDKEFMYHNYPINQLFGIQNQLPSFMATTHQLTSKRDAEYYILRLAHFRRKFQQVLEGLNIREQMGVIPPRFVFEKVLAEMQGFVDTPVEENILYRTMAEKLVKIPGLDSKMQDTLLDKTKGTIAYSVYPAYQLLIDYFTQLMPQANTDAGVWNLPQGAAYYQNLLRRYTTTDLTAEEIHTLGLKEVARIQGQMQDILGGLGYTGKPLVELMKDLALEQRFNYPDTQESREQVLKDYQHMIDTIAGKLDHIFDVRPKAAVKVERIPEFKEKTAPGAYYHTPAMDGSRPGVFYVNLFKLPVKFDMETLAFHEAIPGHHFQLAIQQELRGLPTFRKVVPFTAYAEGWALYAEKLAYEHNLFSDQFSVLGYLSSELFRAVRLVVDTGLHHKAWTREQAIEYMLNNTCSDEVSVVIEVERYIVMPGQATAYKIGELEILRLREKARRELGDAFNIRDFHNTLLKNGSVPLKILAQLVDRYIDEKRPVSREQAS
jgi:uncharacterized protein (DUF885 family)